MLISARSKVPVERIEDLMIFVRTADNAGMFAAACELDITPAVVSVALKKIEALLHAG